MIPLRASPAKESQTLPAMHLQVTYGLRISWISRCAEADHRYPQPYERSCLSRLGRGLSGPRICPHWVFPGARWSSGSKDAAYRLVQRGNS